MTYDPYAPRTVPPKARKAAAKAVSASATGAALRSKDASQAEAFSEEETGAAAANNVAAAELRQLLERIERLDEEKQTILDDIKDIFGEAKGRGYDTKAMRTILKMRKQDKDERMEAEAILETYMAALGMI